MNRILEVCLISLTLATSMMPSVAAKSLAVPENSSFAGTWEGSMNGLPGINLKIEEADGKVSGTAVFYLQQRKGDNLPWHATGESEVPLLAPQVKGKTLIFAVQHHRCHGCSESGPNVKFRMELVGASEARLWNLDGEQTGSSPGLKLLRGSKLSARPAQAMRQGVSVQLAVTRSAAPMPDADHDDASIVAVTESGSVYLGTDAITPAGLAEEIKGSLSNGDRKLYIKADARTAYANVEQILEAAHTAGVTAPILLTAQSESSEPGAMVSPKGLEVLVGQPISGSQAPLVEVLNSGRQGPTLKISNQQISSAALPSALARLLQNRSDKVVLVKADGRLPFADVVHVIDTCRSTGAKVVLPTPGL
jgi:biopolymer transport protein ExbD